MSQETVASAAVKAYQIMSHPLFTAHVDDSIADVASLFLEYNISGAPVLGKDGNPVGVITKTDLARYQRDKAVFPVEASATAVGAEDVQSGDEDVQENRVEKWMTPAIFSVSSEAGLEETCRAMLRQGTHHIFVRDDATGRLLGVVTSFDLLKVLADLLGRQPN